MLIFDKLVAKYRIFLLHLSLVNKKLNSVSYWNYRYRSDWEYFNGRLQTAFFAVGFVLLDENFEAETILDYGCGCGDSLPVLKMRFPKSKLFFYDFSKEAMAKASASYSNIAQPVTVPKNSFDLVYCSNVIEHIEDPDTFVKELLDLSKKYLVIQAPYNELGDNGFPLSKYNRREEHINTITENFFEKLRGIRIRTRKVIIPKAWDNEQIFFIIEKVE